MSATPTGAPAPPTQVDQATMTKWILELRSKNTREAALLELSKRRDMFPELPLWLWYSYGTMAILIQEIIDVYPSITPEKLNAIQSNRVCNALALMQCVASDNHTRKKFLNSKIASLLFPFLRTKDTNRPFEFLRLTALGVIGALIKTDDEEVIRFLLSTDVIPICLTIMEKGSELSKTVATFIIQKILIHDLGLGYICQTYERFSQVALVLGALVLHMTKAPSPRLLKHVIRCYMRLSENPRALKALKKCLPESLKSPAFQQTIVQDKSLKSHWDILMQNLAIPTP